VTGFEFNEDLKDCCLLLGANTAVTIFFENGVPIIPEPFYETHIVFPKHFKAKDISLAVENIRTYLEQFMENRFDCTDIIVESRKGVITLIYTIFCNKKKFTTKQLKYLV
jgi:hypothetical protein